MLCQTQDIGNRDLWNVFTTLKHDQEMENFIRQYPQIALTTSFPVVQMPFKTPCLLTGSLAVRVSDILYV